MEFPITTYRSQALMNHLPLPSVLVDLIKNFVFFNTSTFYRLVEQPMNNKRIVGGLIIEGHTRADRLQPEDFRCGYIRFYRQPERWSFGIDPKLLSKYVQKYSSRRGEITATNCTFCGNYKSDAESLTVHTRGAKCRAELRVAKIFCKCITVRGINEREMPKKEREYTDYDSETSLIILERFDRDKPTEVPVAINYGPAILPPPRRRRQPQQKNKSGL